RFVRAGPRGDLLLPSRAARPSGRPMAGGTMAAAGAIPAANPGERRDDQPSAMDAPGLDRRIDRPGRAAALAPRPRLSLHGTILRGRAGPDLSRGLAEALADASDRPESRDQDGAGAGPSAGAPAGDRGAGPGPRAGLALDSHPHRRPSPDQGP